MITNIKAAKRLVDKYESITIEDIINIHNDINIYGSYGKQIAHELTGFSNRTDCILCKGTPCSQCIHSSKWATKDVTTAHCVSDDTYINICDATNSKELLTAFKKRAKYLKHLINLIETEE